MSVNVEVDKDEGFSEYPSPSPEEIVAGHIAIAMNTGMIPKEIEGFSWLDLNEMWKLKPGPVTVSKKGEANRRLCFPFVIKVGNSDSWDWTIFANKIEDGKWNVYARPGDLREHPEAQW